MPEPKRPILKIDAVTVVAVIAVLILLPLLLTGFLSK